MSGGSKSSWPEEHSDLLRSLVAKGGRSYLHIMSYMNRQLGTAYSRNAVLGRAQRLGLCNPASRPKGRSVALQKAARKRQIEKRKAVRWAANPSLSRRAEEKKRNRAMFAATGTSRTSPEYRQHMPRLKEMSKSQLREMLAEAIRNTAAMEGA